MTDYPRDLSPGEFSPALAALVRDLAGRMLTGPAPQHDALRQQLAAARVARITLTGAGLYAYFDHGPEAARVSPPEMIGGEVPMEVRSLDAPAGSLLKVSDGLLDYVEIYTFGYRPWPDQPRIVAFGNSTPLPIPERAT